MNIKDITGPGSIFNVQNMNVFVVGGEPDKKPIVNPGVDYGSDGVAKMSPPLQQQLAVMKDAVGVTTDDVVDQPTDDEVANQSQYSDTTIDRIKELAALFSHTTNFPSG